MAAAQLSLAELGARLFAPTEPCRGCGALGEWARSEDGGWTCAACHAGCPLAGCNPPNGLSAAEMQLWHLARTAQRGGVADAVAHWDALIAYEAAMEGGVAEGANADGH